MFHRLGALHTVDVHPVWMPAVGVWTVDIVPRWHRCNLWRLLEDRGEWFSIHVLANRQAEDGEYGRGQVKDTRGRDGLVLLDARSLGDENAVRPMLNRRARGLDWNVLGS